MDFTREEIESAALVLVADEEGHYRWSSHHSDEEVAMFLAAVSEAILYQNAWAIAEALAYPQPDLTV